MYTVAALPPVEASHAGFFIVLIIAAFILLYVSIIEEENFGGTIAILAIFLVAPAYFVSYHTGEQNALYYKNTPVIGTLKGYIAEGHSVSERHGKTTRQVDKHYVYVSYVIEGNEVLFLASTGTAYPQSATFYKN